MILIVNALGTGAWTQLLPYAIDSIYSRTRYISTLVHTLLYALKYNLINVSVKYDIIFLRLISTHPILFVAMRSLFLVMFPESGESPMLGIFTLLCACSFMHYMVSHLASYNFSSSHEQWYYAHVRISKLGSTQLTWHMKV